MKSEHTTFDYNGRELWRYLDPKIVAMVVDEHGVPHGYEKEPCQGRPGFIEGGEYHDLTCLGLTNIPPWKESRRTRPPVRGSEAYWAGAPDWAEWSTVNFYGYEYWHQREPHVVDDSWLSRGRLRYASKGHSTDDWQNSKIQRPHVWQLQDENTPVDTRCYGRDHGDSPWVRGHSAELGKVWRYQKTRWVENEMITWKQIVLADPNDPSRVPPEGLTLGLET